MYRSAPITEADIRILAQVSRINLPECDLEALAEALDRHVKFVQALLDLDLSHAGAFLTFDPRWT